MKLKITVMNNDILHVKGHHCKQFFKTNLRIIVIAIFCITVQKLQLLEKNEMIRKMQSEHQTFITQTEVVRNLEETIVKLQREITVVGGKVSVHVEM